MKRAMLKLLATLIAVVVFIQSPQDAQGALGTPNLRISSVSLSEVRLSWNAISGATNYQVWVWRNGRGWHELDDDFTGTSYTHTGVVPGVSYWYTVAANGNEGEVSDWAEYARADIPPVTPSLRRLERTGNEITVRWGATSGATHYQLWFAHDSGVYKEFELQTGTSYTHSNLVPGSYVYVIRAWSGSKWSGWSNRPVERVNVPTPKLKARSTHSDWVELMWSTAQNTVLSEVQVASSAQGVWQYAWRNLDNSLVNHYIHRDVTSGTTYWYRVKAVHRNGHKSDWSAASFATVPFPPPPYFQVSVRVEIGMDAACAFEDVDLLEFCVMPVLLD